MTLQTYADWAPTPLDSRGAFLDDDRQAWLVVPVMRTRDSGPFDNSNFDAALDILGGESETVELHRFGHWGPGWVEIIIVHPSRAAEAEDIADRLESYPVLDDDDLCEREYSDAVDSWDMWGRREWRSLLVAALRKTGDDDAADAMDDASDDVLDMLASDSDEPRLPDYETHDDGPYFHCLREGAPSVDDMRAALAPPTPPENPNQGRLKFPETGTDDA